MWRVTCSAVGVRNDDKKSTSHSLAFSVSAVFICFMLLCIFTLFSRRENAKDFNTFISLFPQLFFIKHINCQIPKKAYQCK